MSAAAVDDLLLAVPNFSEGRDHAVVEAIERRLAPARLLDLHVDPDHNRSVFTSPVARASWPRRARARRGRRDRAHRPAVPTEACTRTSARSTWLPVVYLSERQRGAGLRRGAHRRGADRRRARDCRCSSTASWPRAPSTPSAPTSGAGGPAGLAERMAGGELVPDYGPRAPHPTAGAVLVTARPPLIAFNVDLVTDDVEVARRIAASLRESGGGLPGVRAIGLFLADRGRAQVSTNVHDHRAAPLREIVARVREPRPRWPRPSWWGWRRGPRSRAFPTTCRCAASPPSATDRGGARTRWCNVALADGPDEAKAHAQAPRHPGGHDRAGGPHGAPAERTRTPSRSPASGARSGCPGRPPGAGAINRAAIAAAVFGVLVVLLFERSVAQGAVLAAFMLLLYIPLGYATDLAHLPLPPASPGRGEKVGSARWTCACSPSGPWPRTRSSSGATARTAR